MLSSIIIEEPVEVLVSEETEIKQELQNELNKATTFLSNDTGNANSSARKILELRGKLQTIAGQKSIAELSSQVQASVASTLKNEVNQINSY
ncbi:MAG: hypothetical protein HY094_04685 [Candidatus Melainabacteria bacterium]|nr:hypothetical protein [Candidatus Melainabacteria bacterium]